VKALAGRIGPLGDIRNRRAERRPLPWLFGGIGIAALWSCCLGLVVLQLFLTLRDSLA
jgi:hypothetical protein